MTTTIATTREQAARLLQCGVDPETADMHWHGAIVPRGGSLTSPPEPSEEWDLFNSPYGFMPEEMKKAKLMEDYNEIIPAWSLSALLGLLPKEIEVDSPNADGGIDIEDCYLCTQWCMNGDYADNHQWCAFYTPGFQQIGYCTAPELIDALYSLLVWCLEKGYVK